MRSVNAATAPFEPDFNQYVGLPFVEVGRTREGLDCWGLVRLVYQEQYGIELPLLDGYADMKDKDRLAAIIEVTAAQWGEVGLESAQPGDVLVLRLMGRPTHVGVYVGDRQMLHITKGIDASIERLDRAKWKGRVMGVYRHA